MLIIASTENAERVLACMSACKGIPTDSLKEPDYWRRLNRSHDQLVEAIKEIAAHKPMIMEDASSRKWFLYSIRHNPAVKAAQLIKKLGIV